MKKGLIILASALFFLSCGNSAKQDVKSGDVAEQAAQSDVQVYSLEDLLANAETLVDKPVSVKGHVTHTCKHSGRRCFLAGDSSNVTIRVEAKGDIGGFNRELIGSEIVVNGVLHENRLSPTKIAEMEKSIESKKIKDDGSAESCDTETANIQNMRAWMKDHGKDYYPIYYIDGQNYDEVK